MNLMASDSLWTKRIDLFSRSYNYNSYNFSSFSFRKEKRQQIFSFFFCILFFNEWWKKKKILRIGKNHFSPFVIKLTPGCLGSVFFFILLFLLYILEIYIPVARTHTEKKKKLLKNRFRIWIYNCVYIDREFRIINGVQYGYRFEWKWEENKNTNRFFLYLSFLSFAISISLLREIRFYTFSFPIFFSKWNSAWHAHMSLNKYINFVLCFFFSFALILIPTLNFRFLLSFSQSFFLYIYFLSRWALVVIVSSTLAMVKLTFHWLNANIYISFKTGNDGPG